MQTLLDSRACAKAWKRSTASRWLDSLQPEDPSRPDGAQYGYGVAQLRWGPNTMYFHVGETAGYNSKIGYDPTNQVTLIV